MSFQNNNIKTNSKTSVKQSNPLLDTVLKDSSNKKRRIQVSNTKQKLKEQKQSFIILEVFLFSFKIPKTFLIELLSIF